MQLRRSSRETWGRRGDRRRVGPPPTQLLHIVFSSPSRSCFCCFGERLPCMQCCCLPAKCRNGRTCRLSCCRRCRPVGDLVAVGDEARQMEEEVHDVEGCGRRGGRRVLPTRSQPLPQTGGCRRRRMLGGGGGPRSAREGETGGRKSLLLEIVFLLEL